MPWTVFTRREATSAAARALITSPAASDAALAERSGCSTTTIGTVRAKLEAIGVIERVPVHLRTQRPRPQQPSATRDAIERLGPDATPRAIADAAQVSMQAAWRALSKARPRLADAAGAVDALTVSKMPRQLADAAAAADHLMVIVTLACAQCSAPFDVSPRNTRRRYCTPACADAAAEAQGHAPRPRLADPSHPPPPVRELPRPPDWSRGICAHVPKSQQGWWTSNDPVLREAAANLCLGCPILAPCAEFSLALPVTDPSVWAGMSQTERLRRKAQAGRLAAEPKPTPRTG